MTTSQSTGQKFASINTTTSINTLKRQLGNTLPDHWINAWLLHILQKPSVFLITDSDYVLSGQELASFNAGIEKMKAGVPLAYLIGTQDFWSLTFKVNEHTLIPRPDTEVLVEQVLAWINSNNKAFNHLSINDKPKQLLDLGTGSGCIAISLAHELTHAYPNTWQVTAVDLSAEALEVAKANAQLNKVENINFIQSSWFDKITINNDLKFNVIVSNPPYIVDDDSHLQDLKAEPLSALVAQDNGLSDIKHIVNQAGQYLLPNGLLAIEHGHDQGDAVRAIFEHAGFHGVQTLVDYGGNDRVTMGVYLKRTC